MKKRLISVVLCIAMAVTMVVGPITVPQPKKASAKKPDVRRLLEQENTFDYHEGKTLRKFRKEVEDLPEAYDLRHVPDGNGGEVSYVTPVRLQNPFGTCWGFAAIAAAESSLLSSGIAQAYGYDSDTLDLSEKQVAYFATGYIQDPDNPQYGEGTHFKNLSNEDKKSSAYRYNTGGYTLMATSMFASGTGPFLEDYDPSAYGDPETFNYFAYKGRRGEKTFREVATEYDDEGNPVESSYKLMPLWYSSQDDWSIPEKYRFYQNFRLKNSFILPDTSDYDDEGNYVLNQNGVDAVKQQIAQYHRAVCVCFCAESYLPGQDTSGKLYMSDKWAHFTNVFDYSNHAVTIVGYDDNYPKENFSSSTENGGESMPEGNGAFLVKNSWGSEMNSFPTNGLRHWGMLDGLDKCPYDPNAQANPGNKSTGYFWISYYDRSLNDFEAFEFEDDFRTDNYFCEEWDFMAPSCTLGKQEPGLKMANVFETDETSILNEASVLTVSPGTDVEYDVYILGEGFKDPEDGVHIETGTRHFDYSGYHRFDLSSHAILAKGQKYSIVMKLTNDWDDYVPYVANLNNSDDQYHVAVINEGESFYYNGEKWGDLSDDEVMDDMGSYYLDYDLEIDNLPIKTFLDPVRYNDGTEDKIFNGYLTINNWAEDNPGTFNVKVGDNKTLAAEIRGSSEDMPDDMDTVFSWVPVDDDILEVTNSTPRKGEAVIKGLKAGTTELIVYAGSRDYTGSNIYPDNYGIRVLTINVNKPSVWNYDIDDSTLDCVYTGEEKKPEVKHVWSDASELLEEGVDYTVSYEDNINVGTAKTVIEGIGEYGGRLEVPFEIKPADNPFEAYGRTVNITYTGKRQTIVRTDAITIINHGYGDKTYTKESGDEFITINEKTGNFILDRDLEAGDYLVDVNIMAAGDDNHESAEQKVTVLLKVAEPVSTPAPTNPPTPTNPPNPTNPPRPTNPPDPTEPPEQTRPPMPDDPVQPTIEPLPEFTPVPTEVPSTNDNQSVSTPQPGSSTLTNSTPAPGSTTKSDNVVQAGTTAKTDNTLSVKGKKVTVSFKKLQSKKQKLTIAKVFAFTDKGQGALTFTKASGNKKISIQKTGKVIINKGLKRGTYTVKVKVRAAGNETVNAVTKQTAFRIRVR